ncbi:hypothetical protein NRK67_12290 [Fusobacteria bacterium ZRK30]|nr:hypothetical protein NRK67_12290 [Fusobacteria bacterium ZRK30]
MIRNSKKVLIAMSLLLASISLTGCSVMMAASGKKEPNLTVVRKNSERFQIEAELGLPTTINDLEDGNVECLYKYYVGAEPSVGRAAIWLAADVFFFFIPELITTPYEAAKGEKKYIKVIYDKNDKFIKAIMS